MVQLWETSETTQFNCGIADNDKPYFVPIKRDDFFHMRLNIPYQYVAQNGGGLPIGASVALKIVDETGASTLCDYLAANGTRFLFAYKLDTVNRIAEYQFMGAIFLKDENAHTHNVYTFDVADGDIVNLDINGTVYYFTFGTDEIPMPLVQYEAGKICFGADSTTLSASLEINGVAASINALTATAATCSHEDFRCWRFKVSVTFATLGVTKDFYSVPFRIDEYDQNDTVLLQAQYPTGTIDCAGQIHTGTCTSGTFDLNRLFMRIRGEIQTEPSRIKKTYNSRSNAYKSERTKQYKLFSEPIPYHIEDAVETMIAAKTFEVDNTAYYFDNAELISEIPEGFGSDYKNLAVSLSSTKCEKVFVC